MGGFDQEGLDPEGSWDLIFVEELRFGLGFCIFALGLKPSRLVR